MTQRVHWADLWGPVLTHGRVNESRRYMPVRAAARLSGDFFLAVVQYAITEYTSVVMCDRSVLTRFQCCRISEDSKKGNKTKENSEKTEQHV